MDGAAVDILPVQPLLGDAPQRALAEARTGGQDQCRGRVGTRRERHPPVRLTATRACPPGAHGVGEEGDAREGVGFRALALGWIRLERYVLLQHVPAAIALLLERLDDAGDIDAALTERDEQAVEDGFAERYLASPNELRIGSVPVLEMH